MIKHRIPETITDMIKLCRFFDQERGIESILNHVDWADITPAQVYSAVLNRLPESRQVAVRRAGYSSRDHFEVVLNSREFQENMISLLTSAFPSKRRLVFIHIPRTAGTDLEGNLEQRYPNIHHKVTVPEDIEKSELFSCLKAFAEDIDLSEAIFISGHIELRWYCDHRICRFGDHLFTIVRDPMDLWVSWVNYVVMVVLAPENDGRPDKKRWMAMLGIEALPSSIDDNYRKLLATKVIRTESIVGRNILCSYLGAGTADSALEMLARCSVEITTIELYPEWLQHSWGVRTTTRRMQSATIITKHTLSQEDYDYLYERSGEDQILYGRITDSLAASGNLSVNGLVLAS
jgi:hypothetical protein